MSDNERGQLILTMGANIGKIDSAIQAKDLPSAQAAFIKFIAAAGFLAQEIDELDSTLAN
jgi:hypothetical protein